MFRDRQDAGQKLGRALKAYKNCEGVVLAIPRGGVEVGRYVAECLELPLSIIVVRKLPFPDNPEAGFGAIAEDGSTYFDNRVFKILPSNTVERIVEEQKLEIRRRIKVLREGESLPALKGRTVILVDDGIAMGSTIRAAVMLCKNSRAGRIVAAAPVAGPGTASELAETVDDVVVIEKPAFFRAVAEVYENWYDVSDEEVLRILQEADEYQVDSKEGN